LHARSNRVIALAAMTGVVAFVAILPEIASSYVVAIIISILSYVALTEAWNILSGYTGYFFFGAAAFYGVGQYAGAILMSFTPYYASVALSASLAFVIACGLGIVFLRIRGAYFAIGSYALTAALANVVFYWQSHVARTTGVLVPVQDNSTVMRCMLAIALVTIGTAYLIKNSKFGLGLFAIRENEDAAETAGVNTTLYKVVAFGICGLLMGATGAAVVARLGYVDVFGAFAEYISIYPVVMGLLGGIGTVVGPIMGAVIVGSIFEVFFGSGDPYPFELGLALLLICIVQFVPSGFPEMLRHLSRLVVQSVETKSIPSVTG